MEKLTEELRSDQNQKKTGLVYTICKSNDGRKLADAHSDDRATIESISSPILNYLDNGGLRSRCDFHLSNTESIPKTRDVSENKDNCNEIKTENLLNFSLKQNLFSLKSCDDGFENFYELSEELFFSTENLMNLKWKNALVVVPSKNAPHPLKTRKEAPIQIKNLIDSAKSLRKRFSIGKIVIFNWDLNSNEHLDNNSDTGSSILIVSIHKLISRDSNSTKDFTNIEDCDNLNKNAYYLSFPLNFEEKEVRS
jgi:hypothetical protein